MFKLVHSKLPSFLPVTSCMKKMHSQPPSKREASDFSWQVPVRSYERFPFFGGKYRFLKWCAHHFIQWYTVQLVRTTVHLTPVVSFRCAAPESYRALPSPKPERSVWRPLAIQR
jgi:hypothetical protein